ncbi:hypothetical protein COBRASIX_53 [Enterobacter phage vB_EclS_CobraSix]|uniref:Uncharacterized protein n=1 Tax=Enterobacter phage vB_EclS_CobraSix TaxID=2894794 RepID=A0AAE8YNX9_9CAUD|nr:hypothetical protein PQD12_gp51 [Enterobacter phage vB_EclS_CobraSix]UGO47218.1 hypothetical protein COBRASIX_53 [Enterobacter phage vB_EclS_CobraSix]
MVSTAGRLTPVAYSLPSAFAEKVCFCTHPKTFQLRTIAALPEPAGRPTHGLLSRRSTDRMSTSPLANFAQLSMFRFDGLKIQIKLYYRQQTKLYLMACETYVSVFVGNLFCKDEKKPA